MCHSKVRSWARSTDRWFPLKVGVVPETTQDVEREIPSEGKTAHLVDRARGCLLLLVGCLMECFEPKMPEMIDAGARSFSSFRSRLVSEIGRYCSIDRGGF